MSPEDRAAFAQRLRSMMETRRDVFVIDASFFTLALEPLPEKTFDGVKKVSAAALKLLLDYCENSEWTMSLPEYCAGIFHGRELQPGETAFDLLPDVQERLSADRLGFGHIYGRQE